MSPHDVPERQRRPVRVTGMTMWVAMRMENARVAGPFTSKEAAEAWGKGERGVWVALVLEDPEEGYA